MEMKPSVAYPLLGIVFIMMAGAVTLKALHEDIEIIIMLVTLLAVPVLGAFGISIREGIQDVKANTNGVAQRQAEINQENQKALQELVRQSHQAMQEHSARMQEMVTQIALHANPPAATSVHIKEADDDPPALYIPG